jgi:hypothetical protein
MNSSNAKNMKKLPKLKNKRKFALHACCAAWAIVLLLVQYILYGMPGAPFLSNTIFFKNIRNLLYSLLSGEFLY